MARGERVLITGGAGFIGSHLADALARSGHEVVLYDMLEPQVHGGEGASRPDYLDPAHRLVVGDIRDPEMLGRVLREVDLVFHLAAMVGVGQSMYQVRRYTDVNTMGAANVLQLLVDNPGKVRKVLVASSMSVYGEGGYCCRNCGRVAPRLRPIEQLEQHDWEVKCPRCREPLEPMGTDEEKPLQPASIYAINKRDHEEMFLTFGQAYKIPAVALRFFNIYGSRQALSNPYTGVAAIFCSRMLGGKPPLLFEDGNQWRDPVHVSDIVQALTLAMDNPNADYDVFNVSAGNPLTVRQLAAAIAKEMGYDGQLEVTNKYRAGDVRHCYACIAKIRDKLGFRPRVRFEDGVSELVAWVSEQEGRVRDPGVDAVAQLAARGLAR